MVMVMVMVRSTVSSTNLSPVPWYKVKRGISCVEPHGMLLTTYVNPIAYEALESGSTRFPKAR